MNKNITIINRAALALVLSGLLQTPATIISAAETCAASQTTVSNDVEPSDIFADKLMTRLKKKVTRSQIDRLQNAALRNLAHSILAGTYDTGYRVAEYECYLSYETLARQWNAPGKHYDQIAGVTGINIPAMSSQTIVVDGLPKDMKAELKTVAWYVGKVGQNFDGGFPEIKTYELNNGINTIDYDGEWNALAYICYYADEKPEKRPALKVHFVNGQVNGYLSPDKTNEEMMALCNKAPNRCMDVLSRKVHSIWTSKGLAQHCKSRDGKPGFRQYMNVVDSLVAWEHRQLGIEKYGRIPKNRTMAYVNYTYYMYQDGLGVSFHADQEPRVLDCRNIVETDDDAIWGLSHEWGHLHQMTPYFNWAGMGEVSNNLQAYYNIMKMGYRTSDKLKLWAPLRAQYLEDKGFSSGTVVSRQRKDAYADRDKFAYNAKLHAACQAMSDSLIAPGSSNPLRALAYSEVHDGALCPLIMMFNYFTENGVPDFAPDWYEALRQNDDRKGSQIEKKGKADKYELIASAQNNNANGKLAELRRRFPESCWVKDNYITEDHCDPWENSVPFIMNFIRKTSRVAGYNLMPYFEKWGYLRQIALRIDDYGTKYYIMTPDMYNEFKADMDALVASGELKQMPEGMVEKISNSPDWFQPQPYFPN